MTSISGDLSHEGIKVEDNSSPIPQGQEHQQVVGNDINNDETRSDLEGTIPPPSTSESDVRGIDTENEHEHELPTSATSAVFTSQPTEKGNGAEYEPHADSTETDAAISNEATAQSESESESKPDVGTEYEQTYPSVEEVSAASALPLPTSVTARPLPSDISDALPFLSGNPIKDDLSSKSKKGKKKNSLTFTETLMKDSNLELSEIVHVLGIGNPDCIEEYNEHIFKIANMLHERDQYLNSEQSKELEIKFNSLISLLPLFEDDEAVNSKLHILVERNFDILIQIATSNLIGLGQLSGNTIRFLTLLVMKLNYWEVYNLLAWKPAIFHFLNVIHYDLNESYTKFVDQYSKYSDKKKKAKAKEEAAKDKKGRRGRKRASKDGDEKAERKPRRKSKKVQEDEEEEEEDEDESTDEEDHDKFIYKALNGQGRPRKRVKLDPFKLEAHRVIKRGRGRPPKYPKLRGVMNRVQDDEVELALDHETVDGRSINYDPDIIHECQLPLAEFPNRSCLRRFSRKYELIRHQETVHSKRKRLFKCYVCLKINPSGEPRIFTRHDTLAKHIRVNHKISGKEAKAEVAYLKKHAEVVEGDDIAVQVGRRRTAAKLSGFEMSEAERVNILERFGLASGNHVVNHNIGVNKNPFDEGSSQEQQQHQQQQQQSEHEYIEKLVVENSAALSGIEPSNNYDHVQNGDSLQDKSIHHTQNPEASV